MRTGSVGSALLLGGTGAMGVSLQTLLLDRGYEVSVTSRSVRASSDQGLTFIAGDAKDPAFLRGLLTRKWDVIIDFMIWSTQQFQERRDALLDATAQYVFLSSYRVFAEAPVLTERSPRLLDVCDDLDYLSTDEYALAKARQENLLLSSGRSNWTIVRPAITYAPGRFQLMGMEAEEWLWRTLRGRKIIFPEDILERVTTMSSGRDVARMISGLIGLPIALGNDFIAATSKHLSCQDVLSLYGKYFHIDFEVVDLGLFQRTVGRFYQMKYDRLVDRIVDNTKILSATGLKEDDLQSLGQGLESDLRPFLASPVFRQVPFRFQGRVDAITKSPWLHPSAFPSSGRRFVADYGRYAAGRLLDS